MNPQSYSEDTASTRSGPLLQVRLFGGLVLTWGDAALSPIAARSARSLLAYLITYRRRSHTRDLLAGTFWPDLPNARARRRLSQALWRIGRVLNPLSSPVPYLLTKADAVQFNIEAPYWLDTEKFQVACSRFQVTQPSSLEPETWNLKQAVGLYRGDFMAGFYDDWAVIERERLREMYLIALSQLLEMCKAREAYGEALRYAQRLATKDPLREEGHREVMRLCHLLDRNNEALQQYELCRAVLAEEFGAETTAATTALYLEITARADSAEAAYLPQPPGLLPSPLLEETGQVPLVGREEERRSLVSCLEQAIGGQGGMVLVEGEAGVGKTRLLQEVARDAEWRGAQVLWGQGRELAELPPYGVLGEALQAGLSSLRANQLAQLVEGLWLREASLILPELAEWLPDLPQRVSLEPALQRSRLLEALTRIVLALSQIAPHLLILEDLHWADKATLEALAHLARRLAVSRVLVIGSYRGGEARERAAAWQLLQMLDRTGYCQRRELPRLTAEETGELVRRGLGLTRQAPRFEARLHRETGGNPLFVLETLRALHDEGVLYRGASGEWSTPWDETTTDYAELPLPPEVYQVIARRLTRLGPDEREMLNTAAVLGANFDLALLLRGSKLEQEWALAAVSELVRRRLLEEEAAVYRFSHDKVRQVVYMEMDEDERRQLHRRAGEALEALRSGQVEALAHHFTHGRVWAKALDYNCQAGDQARNVYAGWEAIGYYDRAIEAWKHLRPADETLGLSLHQARGEICQETGRFDQAEADFHTAHALAGEAGNLEARAQAMNCLSYLHFQRGDLRPSTETALQALNLSQSADAPLQMARALLNRANALRNMAECQKAIAVYKQAAVLFERMDDQVRLADCLNRMGAAYSHLGAYAQAQSAMERSLAIRRRLDDRVGISYSLTNLTGLHSFQGEFIHAKEAAQEAAEIANAIGDPYGQDAALTNLGTVSLEQGSPTEAIPLFERALAISRRIGDRPLEPEALCGLGRAYHYLGDLGRAREMLEQATSIAEVHSERWHVPMPHAHLARVFLTAGKGKQALAQARAGLQMAQELEVPRPLGLTHRVMGEVAAHLGSEKAAAEPSFHFEESVRILREIGANAELARSLAAYGLYQTHSADAGEARRGAALVDEARALFRRLGMAGDLNRLETETAAQLQPGQIRVRLPAASAPTGRPLRDGEWVEVVWTVATSEDESISGKVARRRRRLLRLLREAEEQGAAPTVDDLAEALEVSRATIKRDLAGLRRAGHAVHTRGSRSRSHVPNNPQSKIHNPKSK